MKKTPDKKKPNVAIIAGPVDEVGKILLDSLVNELCSISNQIFIITTNLQSHYSKSVHVIELGTVQGWSKRRSLSFRAYRLFVTQVKFSITLLKLFKRVDIVLFHLGEYMNILPLLTSKLAHKKSAIFHLGGNKVLQERTDESSFLGRTIVPILSSSLLNIAYTLTNRVICESDKIISFGGLDKYEKKVYVTGGRWFNASFFGIKTKPSQKDDIICFVGKLWQVKGILNLVDSIPLVLSSNKNVKLIIIGDGYLKALIERNVKRLNIANNVIMTGWVPNNELSIYFKQMKLLVLPSYTEGIPGVVLEAMASGVIVLATPVGGVPDLVQNKRTGFILKSNTPQIIAKTIISALNDRNLDQISANAYTLIEKNYSYEAIVGKYRKMLAEIINA